MDRTMMTVFGIALLVVMGLYLAADYQDSRPPHWVNECVRDHPEGYTYFIMTGKVTIPIAGTRRVCEEYRRVCETGVNYTGDRTCL